MRFRANLLQPQIIFKLLKIIIKNLIKQLNLSPTVLSFIDSIFKLGLSEQSISGFHTTNTMNPNIDYKKANKVQLINLLINANSEEQANYIRTILKKRSDNKVLIELIISALIVFFVFYIAYDIARIQIAFSVIFLIIAFLILFKVRMYFYRKYYPCEYCYTSSKISKYIEIDLQHTGSSHRYSSQNNYVGHDNYAHYYTTTDYQTTTHRFDRKCKCPCCGYPQVIKVEVSSRSRI